MIMQKPQVFIPEEIKLKILRNPISLASANLRSTVISQWTDKTIIPLLIYPKSIMNILYVSREYKGKGGANQVAERNYQLLKQISDNIDVFRIPLPNTITRVINLVFQQSYGQTINLKKKFISLLKNNSYDIVFFDGSYYGGFVEICYKFGYKIVCFYHNVEYIYYQEKYKLSNNLLDKFMAIYIHHNEYKSTLLSTTVISISSRDKKVLKQIYNREADDVLETSFSPIEEKILNNRSIKTDYLLFVGTKFFANKEAVDYIIDKIAPFIKYEIWIIGDICDIYLDSEIPENIRLLGLVDNLDKYYVNALGVLVPIFSGSGLKTKSIEALKYGKTIIGSLEAFEGIPLLQNPNIGRLCNSSDDYISYINSHSFDRINRSSLEIFNQKFSDIIAKDTLKHIISNTIDGK